MALVCGDVTSLCLILKDLRMFVLLNDFEIDLLSGTISGTISGMILGMISYHISDVLYSISAANVMAEHRMK